MKNILIILYIITGLGFSASASTQSPGTFDPAFANSGELADSAIFPYRYSGLALSPGGEFVISSANGDTIQAIRYTSAGNRDINFGTGSSGLVHIVTPGFKGTVTTSAVQTDRKILIAGQYTQTGSNKKAYIVRLNADGTIDNTFGAAGWLLFNFLPHFGEVIHQVILQPDGKILATDQGLNGGNTDTLIIARINTNGTFDNTFASNGLYQIPLNRFLATSPNIITLDANNNILFAGYSNYNAGDYLYSFRLTTTGALDQTYGNNGTLMIDSTNIINGGANLGLNFQSDGKLITVQTKQTGSILWALCRYNTDGSVDQSFGNNGLVNVQPNLSPVPYYVTAITETSKKSIVIAGVVSIAGALRTIVCSFNADGSTDLGFGNNAGSELLNCFELDDYVYNLILQPDDKILVNGLVNEDGYKQYNVVRLLAAEPVAVKQLSNDISFSVSPNPAGNEVHVNLPATATGTLTITDLTGKLLNVQHANGGSLTTINIADLSSGIYFVTYQDNDNKVSKKIVKQ